MLGCPMYDGTARLDGNTAIVTGSNTGIGKLTVVDFVKRGKIPRFCLCFITRVSETTRDETVSEFDLLKS
jgi:hypothetical protein